MSTNFKKGGAVLIVMMVLGFLIKLFWITTITATIVLSIRFFMVKYQDHKNNPMPEMWKDWGDR